MNYWLDPFRSAYAKEFRGVGEKGEGFLRLLRLLMILGSMVLLSGRALAQYKSSVVAWGENSSGETNVPSSATNIVAVAGRDYQSLALRSDGTLLMWGSGATVPSTATNVVAIAAMIDHSLALRADGTVIAWGTDYYGETKVPPSATNVVAISAGFSHNLALRIDGSVVAWGDPLLTNVPAMASNVVGVAAGHTESYVIRDDGLVATWPNCGCLLSEYVSATNVVRIAAGPGQSYNLAIRADGSVCGWSVLIRKTDVPATATNVIAAALGDYHRLVLRGDGTIVAWGNNVWGQTNVPPTATNAIAIGAGWMHSLAVLGNQPWVASTRLTNTFYSGQRAVLVANAVGAPPLRFYWLRDGVPVIDSARREFVLTNTQPSDSGFYSVVVSNSFGVVTGQVARLTFADRPPLRLGSFSLQPPSHGGGFELQLTGLAGRGPIIFFASSNLVSWESIFTNPPVVGSLQYTDTLTTNRILRFYRAAEMIP